MKQILNTASSEQEQSDDSLAGIQQRSISRRHSDQLRSQEQDWIAEESAVAISYNGHSHAVMMVSPIDLLDFALGFSLSENIIDKANDILNVECQPAKQGYTVNIQIRAELMQRLEGKQRGISGRSGCGVCGISELAAALPKLPTLDYAPAPSHGVVHTALASFSNKQVLQQRTGAIHAAALCNKKTGEVLLIREDIGRHNALDKLIGALTKSDNIDRSNCFALLSSRASHELVSKTVMANINCLVSVSAATSLAIDLAEQSNLNLIGFLRGQRQVVYSKAY